MQALAGALEAVLALRPVTFRWKADASEGHGLVAEEVADVVPGVVTGAPEAVDAEGRIVPQQIDYAKLVPWLLGAVQALAARVAS